MRWLVLIVVAGCAGRASTGPTATLRPAPAPIRSPAVAKAIAANEEKLEDDPPVALASTEANAARGPFDRVTYAQLWHQRGIAHALIADMAMTEAIDDPSVADAKHAEQAEHEAAARKAFDMLLALDPTHRLEYTETPKATWLFEEAIARAAARPAPEIDVDWKRGLAVGDAVPVDVEVIADPAGYLARAVVFVRRRGVDDWQAADLELPDAGGYRRVILPAALTAGTRAATTLELYVRAYDQEGNEVLDWASQEHPRELPLRWDPPTPWYRKWWVWAIAGTVVAGATGVAVYAASWSPSDLIVGGVVIE